MADFSNGNFNTDLSGWQAGMLPTDLSGETLSGWLDASQETSYSDNDAVGQATDWSGNNNHFVQSNASLKPTYKTNIINGKPVFRLGGDDTLQAGSNHPSGSFPYNYYFIIKILDASTNFFASYQGGGSLSTIAIVAYGAGGPYDNIYYTYWGGDDSASSNNVWADNTPFIMSQDWTSTTNYRDSDINGTNVIHDSRSTKTTSADKPKIVGYGTMPDPGADYAEGIYFTSELSAQQDADIMSYLAFKYGITIANKGANGTRDTTTKYEGAASLKVVSINPTDYYEYINPGTSGDYTLEGYAYTTGAEVTSADIELFYDGSAISTTFTDMGSGWYKLTATVTGADAVKKIGVQVKANKTVYVDNFSLSAAGGGEMTTNTKFWGA